MGNDECIKCKYNIICDHCGKELEFRAIYDGKIIVDTLHECDIFGAVLLKRGCINASYEGYIWYWNKNIKDSQKIKCWIVLRKYDYAEVELVGNYIRVSILYAHLYPYIEGDEDAYVKK